MRIENMTTSEEIIKKYGVNKNEPMLKDMLDEAKAEGYKEGERDTIIKLRGVELDALRKRQILKEVFTKIEDKVIFIRGNNEDIGIFLSSAKNYFALKKEYKIEE
jgi:hypothetical protein